MGQQPIKAWKIGLFFLGALIVLMSGTLIFMPREYQVSRSQLIAAPPEQVYAALADLEQWPSWLVWLSTVDETVKVSMGDRSRGVGAELAYRGSKLGSGRFVITKDKPSDLEFSSYQGEGDQEQQSGRHRIVVEPEGELTRVVWSMLGQVGEGRLENVAVGARERLAVRDFDASLTALKTCVERGSCAP